ncbi:MAG: esterase family protein [Clostridia bacterium]|nr:esterase family protein [Clostridia bacterium]
MALVQLHLFAKSLGIHTEVEVVIPQRDTVGEIGVENGAKNEKYRCLYLLHGLSDDQSIWLRRTSIERYATDYGICVVMPSGGRSFYMNQQNGQAYYDYIAKELPARMSEFFNVSDKREDRVIAGNSMGGYGALKLALRENKTFCAAAGLSSVADIRTELFKDTIANGIGKDKYLSDDEDLFALSTKYEKDPNRPRLYMACGTEDFLYQDNVKLRNHLQQLDYDYTYEESPGIHTWSYWDEKIQRVLEWAFGDK